MTAREYALSRRPSGSRGVFDHFKLDTLGHRVMARNLETLALCHEAHSVVEDARRVVPGSADSYSEEVQMGHVRGQWRHHCRGRDEEGVPSPQCLQYLGLSGLCHTPYAVKPTVGRQELLRHT